MTRARLLALALVAGLLAAAPAGARPDAEPLRVLFVGNSLTTTNDLPANVAALANAGGKAIEVGKVTVDGYALEDHWNRGDVRRELATGDWDVAIMQQGPSALLESQVNLRQWAVRLAEEARAAGTRPALMSVWPESYRREALADVIVSYRVAAQEAGADYFPAGDAWLRAWQCDRAVPLYGRDGFHPSRQGTHLAALVVYGRLFKAPLLVPSLRLSGVSARTARLLQASAAQALGRRIPAARRCGAR
jgi:hypothetical protein